MRKDPIFWAGEHPKCFTRKQWDDWRHAWRWGFVLPCQDCIQEHKDKMIAAGRCENPDFDFEQQEPI